MNINNMLTLLPMYIKWPTCQNVLYIFAHSGEKKNFNPKLQAAKLIK